MRRQFLLPKSDRDYLDNLGLNWETVSENGVQWLLLHAFPIPDNYSLPEAMTAIAISPGYPDTQLDMVWFSPALARKDGIAIGALCEQQIDGKTFQRWSRHYTQQHPWRPGDDDISTHLLLVREWLEREFKKR